VIWLRVCLIYSDSSVLTNSSKARFRPSLNLCLWFGYSVPLTDTVKKVPSSFYSVCLDGKVYDEIKYFQSVLSCIYIGVVYVTFVGRNSTVCRIYICLSTLDILKSNRNCPICFYLPKEPRSTLAGIFHDNKTTTM